MKNNNLFPYKNLYIKDMEGEIWKDIQGYDGYYQVSNFGRIKSLSRTVFNGMGYYLKKEKIIKQLLHNHGYLSVMLYTENVGKMFLVHKLVANEFIQNLFNKERILHLDHNKKNNKLSNLEWTNYLEIHYYKSHNKKSKSKFVGVYFRKDRNKWISSIIINRKAIYLGCSETEEGAYKLRVEYEKKNNIENKYL